MQNFRYYYGDDGETLSDGTVTVTFVRGEVEDMVASPLHPYDVNRDLRVNSDDIVPIIRFIDSPLPRLEPHSGYDVNGDELCTPLDALLVINFANNHAEQAAEGEGDVAAVEVWADSPTPAALPPSQPSRPGLMLVPPTPTDARLSSTDLCVSQAESLARATTGSSPESGDHGLFGRHPTRQAMRVPRVIGDKAVDLADALDAELDAALWDIAEDVAEVWNATRRDEMPTP